MKKFVFTVSIFIILFAFGCGEKNTSEADKEEQVIVEQEKELAEEAKENAEKAKQEAKETEKEVEELLEDI